MHAVVLMVTLNDPEAAISQLRDEVLPEVKQAPGLVAGYWTRGKDDSGIGMVVLESEDAANAMSDRVAAAVNADDNVTLKSVEVREVVANV
jgi:hypothetical protein